METRHSYSDAYVNRNGTVNGLAIHHVYGNDNEITKATISNGVPGFETAETDDPASFGIYILLFINQNL